MNYVHGIDVIDVPRVAAMLDKHGDHFINRCFTKVEQEASEVSYELYLKLGHDRCLLRSLFYLGIYLELSQPFYEETQ